MALTEAGTGKIPAVGIPGIGQKGVDALSERPYLRDCAGQSFECADGIFHDRLIEPSNETLVRTKDNCSDAVLLL
jgi:hypothetical protein